MVSLIPMSRRASAAALTLLLSASTLAAQPATARPRAWELRIPSGALVAAGAQRDQLRTGRVTAVQFSRVLGAHVAVTGTVAWTRSRDLAAEGTPKLDAFSSDLGLEARSAEWITGARTSVSAFAGVGAGGRRYEYRKAGVGATNHLAGFAAAGGEVGLGRAALRLEARYYATGFAPLAAQGETHARGDVMVTGALRIHRRPARARS